jgi:hypothetical protein
MEIPSKKVFEILKDKGVERIYHANSVVTSCQFLRYKSLMSRGTIDRANLFQTPQKSDGMDKRYGIWYDIFADSVDIHHRAKRANAYGPVLFELNVKIIEKAYTGRVWVTKCNPTKWKKNIKHEKRWFTSAQDLAKNFTYGRFDQMIVFRHCGGELPLDKHLEKIILDDPELEESDNGVDYFSVSYGALCSSMAEGGIYVPIEKRACPDTCTCLDDYQDGTIDAVKMFHPRSY